ncbi:HAD-superfamily hydrolase subfamily IA, variant 3 [Moritella viscosa]|uniref:HAD-superfamily hydrolase subfamily IA, variant 3 n=1 Tax=Moritella viscosa TaxID=80854 RepID=A0A1L0ATL0_9GAMM|nr:hypothetical protein [Moritella viscosa]SGY91683.1 HAD-superfamily hydrolase subfamily IA, variant 3 [Moritella viscosa]SHO01891.1 HAD-superfamily hydrolase subfamily IA, variant 3 [Moritella viscosa]SHO02090.1 HAD-superfamily hydrolase subfamily IA, variant 3 [Moritella viscosa]SHO02753.1 HAD-superfamily hydrolase subfamily IA, variant 3 [Moritella viscosa]SHO06403.1 HAD-superfamily hydrolase subfamily IA, variant 3 [Moritella viscosa]
MKKCLLFDCDGTLVDQCKLVITVVMRMILPLAKIVISVAAIIYRHKQ